VLGAGTMGSRIAAHFANAGLPCILLDIVPPNSAVDAPTVERNKLCGRGWSRLRSPSPRRSFTSALAERVAIGNFEDDLARCAEADWIIEVVAENLEIQTKVAFFSCGAGSQAGHDCYHQYFRLAGALNCGRHERGVSGALGGHAFFQSAAVPADWWN